MTVVAVAVVSGPIVGDVVVLLVEIFVACGVVSADDNDAVVVVEQVLSPPVGAFRLLELFWLNEVLMPMLGQVPVVSSAEVLAAA